MTAIAVTIAGSDSGGGAGIQADLKAFSARGVYGASVLTALTAQNTIGVMAVHDLPPDFVAAQMDAVYSDLSVDATKIGMLSRSETILAVAEGLQRHDINTVVLDPVMIAASGDPLIADDAIETLRSQLFPLVTIITPNLAEAARITGSEPACTRQEMIEQARQIADYGFEAVLLKGGHSDGADANDLLLWNGTEMWMPAPRIETVNTHGTGCTLSSALAAELAKGSDITSAAKAAKAYVHDAIAAGKNLHVGAGSGPVHHFYETWSEK